MHGDARYGRHGYVVRNKGHCVIMKTKARFNSVRGKDASMQRGINDAVTTARACAPSRIPPDA